MADTARLTAVFKLPNDKNATIGLDFACGGLATAWNDARLQALVNAGKSGWSGTPALNENFPSVIDLLHCEAYGWDRVVNTSSHPDAPPFKRSRVTDIIISNDAPSPGLVSGAALPPQVAVAVTFNTGLGGRSRRGRVYLPPLPESAVSDAGIVGGTQLSTLEGDFNDWVVGMQNAAAVGETFTHIVASMTLATAFTRTVSARVVNERVDTQRRRLS